MSSFDDVNTARDKLMEALGDKSKQYTQHMKLWFQMKSSKEDFDLEARKLLDHTEAHLHNQFLLQLFIKCSKQDLPLTSLGQHRTKTKRRARQHNGGFQPANVHDYVQPRQQPKPQEEPLRYSVQESFVPDSELIHMRLMLAAWELGLKGAEQSAADILVAAVQHFLKSIVNAILSRKNGFQIRDSRIQYASGMPVPNPWLRNSVGFLSNHRIGGVLEVLESGDSVPVSGLSVADMQQNIALACASGAECFDKRPITSADCFEALQIHLSSVPSNGVYSVNMERIAAQIRHPSWDELGE